MRSGLTISKFISDSGCTDPGTDESLEVMLDVLSFSGALCRLRQLEIDESFAIIQTTLLGAYPELEYLKMVLSDFVDVLELAPSESGTQNDDRVRLWSVIYLLHHEVF